MWTIGQYISENQDASETLSILLQVSVYKD